jgi:glycosyltransferase involved in cell wall biosynthesis
MIVGPFPGPLHGVSVIDAKLAARMEQGGTQPGRIDLAPATARLGPAYHLGRLSKALGGALAILAARLGPRRRYVMSVDGGLGIFYNLILAWAARATGQEMLLYHHSTRYVLAESGPMRRLLSAVGKSAPQVFCSPAMADLFEARYGARPRLIVSNCAWVDPPPEGQGGNGFDLGFLSTLTPEKGLSRALATLRTARAAGLDAHLRLAGPVVDAASAAIIAAAKAEFGPALTVMGVVTGDGKAAFYGGLDVFLFPSLYPHETQSLVVPEALAAGTPVVAFDHRFVGEVVGDGGLLIAPDQDFAAAAVAFIAAGRDGAVRTERRRKARAYYARERAKAEGQVERLIGWATGEAL